MDEHLLILEIIKFRILQAVVKTELYYKSWRILLDKYDQSLKEGR